MITVLLSGGLGNQMFQYAAAKALASRLNTTIRVDVSVLDKNDEPLIKDCQIDVFQINVERVSSLKDKLLIMARPFIGEYKDLFGSNFFTDTNAVEYQSDFESLDGDIILSGHFQNERYFKKYAEAIRTDFNFKEPLSGLNLELSDKLICTESVSLHVKRGRCQVDESVDNDLISCSKDYYQSAIECVMGKTPNPKFYVFSDDIDWVKNNISFPDDKVVYVDWNNGSDSYRNMQLMSLCTHNIIANNSFSWWAAWLNTNSSKIVVAPREWFRSEDKNALLDEFYPSGWIKL